MKALISILLLMPSVAYSQTFVYSTDTLTLNGKQLEHREWWVQPIEDEIQQRHDLDVLELINELRAEQVKQFELANEINTTIESKQNKLISEQQATLNELMVDIKEFEKQRRRRANYTLIGGAIAVTYLMLK